MKLFAVSPTRRRLLGAATATLLAACTGAKTRSNIAAPSLPPATPPRPLKIGLALSGGAARGFAHIGVIKA
ncbi:patatin-like phospholipase family protein, partial [Mycetohabitans sp. B7]|nr:patatin-like phospholipase family protein [Mycetohabitans sp. B7]